MGNRFGEIAFTPAVRRLQADLGSREHYARDEDGPGYNDVLGEHEAAFIAARDSLYLASVSETGWPYVQHRGGPAGFLKVLGPTTIGFADYRGNRQYVSVGNLSQNDRVALILVDYAARQRLKILGHARTVDIAGSEWSMLRDGRYRARAERGVVIEIAAFDWNCPQHITRRFTSEQVEQALAPLRAEIAALKARLGEPTDE
jgi:predicted pyridoxine 5'-phosphate oxidase superfamily flavin-nucleotide-binding protein